MYDLMKLSMPMKVAKEAVGELWLNQRLGRAAVASAPAAKPFSSDLLLLTQLLYDALGLREWGRTFLPWLS